MLDFTIFMATLLYVSVTIMTLCGQSFLLIVMLIDFAHGKPTIMVSPVSKKDIKRVLRDTMLLVVWPIIVVYYASIGLYYASKGLWLFLRKDENDSY